MSTLGGWPAPRNALDAAALLLVTDLAPGALLGADTARPGVDKVYLRELAEQVDAVYPGAVDERRRKTGRRPLRRPRT